MSVMNTTQARELDRQKFDKEIKDAYEVIRVLKIRRNALAHISFLPTEILSRIFIILASSDLDHSDLSWTRSVTAVCGHWRAIALECPNLWCYITFSRPLWAEEMLRRSKMVPLIIKAEHPKTKQINAIRSALQHISRIKELHLDASKETIIELIKPIDKPAPLLRSLHLTSAHYDGMYTLPELFVCDHLQRLELIDCNIPFESLMLCGLLHLKFYKTGSRLSAVQLLEALEKMPLVETLDLSGRLTFYDTTRVVHLSHLTFLRLRSSAPTCAYLLNHISFPASTSLELQLKLTHTDNDHSSICDAVSSVWNGKEGAKLCVVFSSRVA
jgi:hypothetical protein